MTREEAIDVLVEQDVARWGEDERAAALRLHSGLTHGRAVNSILARARMADARPEWDRRDIGDLRRLADRVLTEADRAAIRSGG